MDYIIKNIKDVSDEILDILNNMMNRNCQVGKFSLRNIRDIYSTSTDILYVLENTEPVYFLLLDVFTKHKTVYIHDVCIGKKYRGKGLFKKSLATITKYYNTMGFISLTLDASDSIKEEGLNQKARIHIFHSAGFSINLETGYFTESGDYEIIDNIIIYSNNIEEQFITYFENKIDDNDNQNKLLEIQNEIKELIDIYSLKYLNNIYETINNKLIEIQKK
jgi:hypothetical protein